MKKKCLVQVVIGQEYLWKMSSKLSVSNRSSDLICEHLNNEGWALSQGYKWAVRDYDDNFYSTYGKAYISHGYVRVRYEYGFNR